MSLYSLHADFDRDGVLTASPSEYRARQTRPGTIVAPNLDADGVRLPATVSCGSRPTLDISMTTKSGNDNDLLPVAVIANPGSDPLQQRVVLRLSEEDAQKVKLYDRSRHLLPSTNRNRAVNYPISFNTNRVDLFLEAVTFNASPGGPSLSHGSLIQILRGQAFLEIELHLDVFDPTGALLEQDRGLVSISPLILLGDTSPAEKLYLCEISSIPATLSDNTPTFTEIQSAVGNAAGVQFVPVPPAVHRGDSWLQDQFQVGYSQSASHIEKVVFHLPRLRSDTTLVTTGNSLVCMATDHFPSANLGLFNDFWTRTISVRDVDQGTQNISFINSVELMILFNNVYDVFYYMLRIVMEVEPDRMASFGLYTEITSIIHGLVEIKNQVVQILERALRRESDPVKRQRYQDTKSDLQARVPAVLQEINFRPDGALAARTQTLTLALEPEDVQELYQNLHQLHSSHNYGGNIEVSPPTDTAPLGKIIIGNSRDEDNNSEMDPSLIGFLAMQRVQPLVEIDVSWLQVGHVDEIVSFAAYPDASNTFPVVVASPQKAMQILEEAFLLNTGHLSDLNPDKELYGRPLTTGDSNMGRGPHPVTALLRGKHWLQVYRPNQSPTVMPPKIYRSMNQYYGDIGLSTRRLYPIPWADDHFYNARISVREMLYFGYNSAARVQEKMEDVKSILGVELGGMNVIELPVLFDQYNPEFEKTIAFTPDLINYQMVNQRVLMPRPYGPRMTFEDAIAVLRRVLDRDYHSYLNRRYFERKGLHRTWHWTVDTINELSHVSTGPYNRPIQVDLEWLAEQFKDGFFPETDLEVIKRRIRTARSNAGKFFPNGKLRSGWHKVEIPENKIDLFEAYTQIMFEGTGLTIDWIDSWYYHIRSGGIHCGTNVVRQPVPSPRTIWWNIRTDSQPGDYVLPRDNARVV
jgi:hypothetical protein